jgi:hypothetical protein
MPKMHAFGMRLPKLGTLVKSKLASGPWTMAEREEQARRYGGAAKQQHEELERSKSTGIKP